MYRGKYEVLEAMKAYRITDWNKHYEIAQSRACKRTSWVAVPNSHDGVGYATLAQHERFPEIFAAWILMLQVASKMPIRGLLVSGKLVDNHVVDPKPLTPRSLAIRTRCRHTDSFKLALETLVSDEIGWIEEVDYERAISGL